MHNTVNSLSIPTRYKLYLLSLSSTSESNFTTKEKLKAIERFNYDENHD